MPETGQSEAITQRHIRLIVPCIGRDEIDAVREVLESGFLVQGPKVAAFERAVAGYVGTQHAVAVSSGTAALHLALLAIDVGRGDIVATTPYSWPATANVVELCGAEPLFVEIQRDTYNLDPKSLADSLERMERDGTIGKLKAILPVHAFGCPADLPAISDIASRYDVPMIEDAACALGSSLEGRKAGAWGRMACFSFHPRKALTTGEGGMITTDDSQLADRLRALRNHGQAADSTSADFIAAGFNYRMTDIQASIGLAQMKKFDGILRSRCARAETYERLLEGTGISPQRLLPTSEPNFQSYVVLLPASAGTRRDAIIQHLRESGIEANIGTWHIPRTTFYRDKYNFAAGDFPVADDVFARAVTLPLHAELTEKDQMTVVQALVQSAGSKTSV